MVTAITGRRLLIAGDPRLAAALADQAFRLGAVVALAMGSEDGGSTRSDVTLFDSASELEIECAADVLLEKLNGLDGLIVAIETAPMPPLHKADLQSWERRVMQPLRTAFWLARRGVHELLAAGSGGRVVFVIASGPDSGRIVETALASLARSIAKEYGRQQITCNVVAGGLSSGSLGAAADAALFLVSPAASFVTGEWLRIDRRVLQSNLMK